MNVFDQQMKLAHAFLNKVSERDLYMTHFLGPDGAKTFKPDVAFENDWLYRTLQRVATEDPVKHLRDYLQEWTTIVPAIDPCCSLANIGAPHGHGVSVYFTKPIRKE